MTYGLLNWLALVSTVIPAILGALALHRVWLKRDRLAREKILEKLTPPKPKDLGTIESDELLAAVGGTRSKELEEEMAAIGGHPHDIPDTVVRTIEPPSAQAYFVSTVNDTVSFHTKSILELIEKNDRRNARSTLISNVLFFLLGVATPILLKVAFGIG